MGSKIGDLGVQESERWKSVSKSLLDREAVSAAMRAHFVFGTFQTAARYEAETCRRVETCAVRKKCVLDVNWIELLDLA